ncbi:Aflatoxin B1 aldehyde reductase member 3 [Colletotrichum tropicale]|nr:Aflatoxin B1 aldehyde reductase member 3 [Colletotrichum tropicale]
MSPASTPQLIFGTARFGDKFTNAEQVQLCLDLLKEHHVQVLDTAGRYPAEAQGRSEELIGETKATQQGFQVDTKILAMSADHKWELSKQNIQQSVSDSLRRLKIPKIDTLHIHFPDSQTPIEEQASTLDKLYKQGMFAQLGVSNFTASQLIAFIEVCDKHGRGMEKHLLPILREHGIVFNAFRVIAAGFLSGSLTSGSTEGTRFSGDGRIAKYMSALWDKESLHNAQRKLNAAIKDVGITSVEAALRWAYHHSALGQGDGIILGASKESQIESNIKAIGNGPLPETVVAAIEALWEDLRAEREDSYIN